MLAIVYFRVGFMLNILPILILTRHISYTAHIGIGVCVYHTLHSTTDQGINVNLMTALFMTVFVEGDRGVERAMRHDRPHRQDYYIGLSA